MNKNDLIQSDTFLKICELVKSLYEKHSINLCELETHERHMHASKIVRLKRSNKSLYDYINKDVRDALSTFIPEEIVANTNGHFLCESGEKANGSLLREFRYSIARGLTRAVFNFSDHITDADGIFNHFCDINLIDCEDFTLNLKTLEHEECPHCGETSRIVFDIVKMEIIQVAGFEQRGNDILKICPHPKGIGAHSIKLSIPSGKLIIANNLCSLMKKTDIEGSPDASINFPFGRKARSDYFSKLGLMIFQTSNFNYAVFANQNRNGLVFKPEYICKNNREVKNYSDDERMVSTISPTIWSVCAMDMDEFNRRCKENEIDPHGAIENLDALVVEIEPGTYKATSYYEIDFGESEKFIDIELIN